MAEPFEIAFAVESQRQSIADAVAGAVKAREMQERQECRDRRERRDLRQDKGLDALKHARQPEAGTAGAKVAVMEARASACLSAGSRTATDRFPFPACTPAAKTTPSRFVATADHVFWTWLIPATGVVAGIFAMLAVLLTACFLL